MNTFTIDSENAEKCRAWMDTGRGITVWQNQDLSSREIGTLVYTPAKTVEGECITTPPGWQYTFKDSTESGLERSAFIVRTWKEVARVKVRNGPPCFGHIHRADRKRLDAALEKAGEGAAWTPDYSTRQYGSAWFTAVISIPSENSPL